MKNTTQQPFKRKLILVENSIQLNNKCSQFSACDCNMIGSVDDFCDEFSGQCRCNINYSGRNCSECANGYFNYPDCACRYLIMLNNCNVLLT